jgi:hypothetical protein
VRGQSRKEQSVCQLLACTSIHQIQSSSEFLQSIIATHFGADGFLLLVVAINLSKDAEMKCTFFEAIGFCEMSGLLKVTTDKFFLARLFATIYSQF